MPYMVTLTINIPQRLAYIPYMDPMGIINYQVNNEQLGETNIIHTAENKWYVHGCDTCEDGTNYKSFPGWIFESWANLNKGGRKIQRIVTSCSLTWQYRFRSMITEKESVYVSSQGALQHSYYK